jgi:type I restriction enzyme S subunit
MVNAIIRSFEIWSTAQTQKSMGRNRGIDNINLHGINRLRELIMELAIQGKLVQQNPNDEPASILLKKISTEKERLVKAKEIKKTKSLPEITVQERPFKLPNGWIFVRLNDIGEWGAGATPLRNKSEYYNGNIPWFKSGELTSDYITESEEFVTELALKETSLRYNKPGDVLIAMYGATIGKTSILKVAATTNQAVCACTPFKGFANIYLLTLLKAYKNRFIGMGAGGAQPNISREKIIATVIALPPLAEQNRIVAKLNELMALCDKLEQQQTNHNETHHLLVETLLKSLTEVADANELKEAWQRIEANFDILFTTEESVDLLKQTILQLAVMGKLTQQNPSAEPASELLNKIAKEKARLVKEGKIKKQTSLPEINDDEKPFELPVGWEWVKFGELNQFINGDRSKNYPNQSEYVNEGVAWINTGHIEPNGRLTTFDMNYITREKFESLRSGKIQKGDIVYCLRGATFGKTAFVEPYEEGAIASSLMIIRAYNLEFRNFIFLYLISPLAKKQLSRFDNGSAQPNLSANSVTLYSFPLPPLAEQHRIVTKVDELFALCNTLKKRIIESQELKVKLADSIVEQTLL